MIYLGFTANDTVPKWLNWWAAYVGSTDWYRTVRWYVMCALVCHLVGW